MKPETIPLPRSEEIVSIAPATGEAIWHGHTTDVAGAIAAARAAWPRWAAMPLANRVELARRFSNELRRVSPSLATTCAAETGKPLWEAHKEIENALARIDQATKAHAERASQRKHDSALLGATAVRHKPLGVIAVISPFCQPVESPISQCIPALIAGNTVLFKPSERASACGSLIAECATRAGYPAGVVNLVLGDGTAGAALVADGNIHGVLFTGSSHVGQMVARRMAARPDRLMSLNLGGNTPLVVWDTPLIEDAAVLVVQSAFACAGQRATAARRLIVADAMAEPLLAAVKRLADRIIVGAPDAEPVPFMGPVISHDAADGLTQSFIWLMSHGGRPIKHMQRLHDRLPFVSPAIIDVTDVADRPDVELYGPLLQVVRVADFDAAIAEANATQYGLAAGLIGGSPQEYNRFWSHVRAGAIHWNRPTTTDLPMAPLGGLGLSGNLRPGGYYTVDGCAVPVASAEMEQPRAGIGAGFGPEV
ncbi:aldehyde dehydrogenase family protein [Novosphingobium sp. FSY-8]|uniref:Aldehyde dehydrogenase family protein n=2 Tax=Novosphingobium ovatum TaxID=1908523 RepID=A0ABW9XBD4_9SPHN|nr:aldehyde dehydrogenase family protein [Novosphingobium ovatum]NBC35838.1 aldehyde dehydrogenase family protein [Novosphingobium ovatum]